MMQKFIPLAIVLTLAGCGTTAGGLFGPKAPEPLAAPAPLPVEQRLPGTAGGQTAAALDTTTAAERSAALAVGPVSGAELGRVLVTLGSPTEPGFWLQTALVSAPTKGRVQAEGGASVAVELRPGTGGAQLSLAAFRALGLALTGLPEVTVYSE